MPNRNNNSNLYDVCLYSLFFFITTASVRKLNPNNGCTEQTTEYSSKAFCVNKTDFQGLDYLHSDTRELVITNNEVNVLTGAPFRNLSKLTHLYLWKSKLEVLKNDAFEGLYELQVLSLKNNTIKIVEDDIFSTCSMLNSIDFSYNRLPIVIAIAKALAPLKFLNGLSFEGNPLHVLAADDFKPMCKSPVTHLNLQKCSLIKLGRGVFSHLHNLKHLYISNNQVNQLSDYGLAVGMYNISSDFRSLDVTNDTLFSIPSRTLAVLSKTRISSLNLENNRITFIKDKSFPLMKTLIYLSLKNCELEYITTFGLKNLTLLEEIDLSFNKFTTMPSGVFYISTLKVLLMNDNVDYQNPRRTFEIYKYTMAEMKNLRVLFLNRVNVQFLSRYTLYGLGNLKELYLFNSLNKIEEFAFETMINLEKLILAHCSIPNLQKNIFKGLGNLTYLDLHETGVELDPDKQHFHDLPNLETLVLESNKLTLLPKKNISTLDKLEMLLVEKNWIAPWNEPLIFGKNLTLQGFDLKINNLDEITPAMIKDFSAVTTIDISNNPFNCSKCNMHEFAKFLNATNKTKPYLEHMEYTTCSSPKSLVDLNLAYVPFYDYCETDILPKILAISISLSIVLALSITSGIVGYHYRWYFRYYWFLTRSRVKRMKSDSASDSFLYDAFITYKANDQPWLVENLLPKLEAEEPRFKMCLHDRDFEIGKEIITNAVESIQNSRFVVLILSNNFLASQWCTWEMNMAQFLSVDDGRNALILIMLESIKKKNMSATLKYLVRTRTYLEWPDNVQGQKLFWERLKFAMRRPAHCNEQHQLVPIDVTE